MHIYANINSEVTVKKTLWSVLNVSLTSNDLRGFAVKRSVVCLQGILSGSCQVSGRVAALVTGDVTVLPDSTGIQSAATGVGAGSHSSRPALLVGSPPQHRPVYTAPAMNAVLMVGCPCKTPALSADFLICHFVWLFISPPLRL